MLKPETKLALYVLLVTIVKVLIQLNKLVLKVITVQQALKEQLNSHAQQVLT